MITVGEFVCFRRLIYQQVRCSIKVVLLLRLRVGRIPDNIEVSPWTVEFWVIFASGEFPLRTIFPSFKEIVVEVGADQKGMVGDPHVLRYAIAAESREGSPGHVLG